MRSYDKSIDFKYQLENGVIIKKVKEGPRIIPKW